MSRDTALTLTERRLGWVGAQLECPDGQRKRSIPADCPTVSGTGTVQPYDVLGLLRPERRDERPGESD